MTIKTWEQRMPARLPEGILDAAMMQCQCMVDEIDELRAELEKIKAQPVPERAEETHCPHGILIADWCKQCFDETNAYFESIEDKP